MTKADIVNQIAEATGLTKTDTSVVVEAFSPRSLQQWSRANTLKFAVLARLKSFTAHRAQVAIPKRARLSKFPRAQCLCSSPHANFVILLLRFLFFHPANVPTGGSSCPAEKSANAQKSQRISEKKGAEETDIKRGSKGKTLAFHTGVMGLSPDLVYAIIVSCKTIRSA